MDLAGKDRAEYVQDTFNAIAGKYDVMNKLMSFGLDKSWRKKVVRVARAKPGMKMLDVCCGTGMLSLELARAVSPTGKVTGLDFSEKMLGAARKNLKDDPAGGLIEFVYGDALKMPFAENCFEGATIGWGLRNLPDLRQGLLEMKRVVKPGSMVVSIDMGKPSVPVYKQIYWLYFKKLVPFLGQVFAAGRSEYQYLYRSASEFVSQVELTEIFQECGYTRCGYINLAFGAVAIVFGQKPELTDVTGNDRLHNISRQ